MSNYDASYNGAAPPAGAPEPRYSDSGRDAPVGYPDQPEAREYPEAGRDAGRAAYPEGGREEGGRGGYRESRGGGGGGRSFGGPRGAGGNAPRPEPSNTLGVFGLSLRTRERDLDDEFQRYGVVQSVTIVYDQKTGRSRCFGFIQMSSTEEATACIEKLNGVELHGRQMRVDYSTTQKPHDPTPGAYMGHKRPEREGGGYSRPRYDDREDRRRDHHHDRRDYDDRRGGYGGRDERYDSYYDRYDDRDRYYYDDRRDRYDRRERSPPRRREYYDSDAQRAPRRYSPSPDGRRDRDPRAGSRAAYDDLAPPIDAKY